MGDLFFLNLVSIFRIWGILSPMYFSNMRTYFSGLRSAYIGGDGGPQVTTELCGGSTIPNWVGGCYFLWIQMDSGLEPIEIHKWMPKSSCHKVKLNSLVLYSFQFPVTSLNPLGWFVLVSSSIFGLAWNGRRKWIYKLY